MYRITFPFARACHAAFLISLCILCYFTFSHRGVSRRLMPYDNFFLFFFFQYKLIKIGASMLVLNSIMYNVAFERIFHFQKFN